MKRVVKTYSELIKGIINNKLYIFSIIIVAILGYGFAITNYSIGMDDTCLDRYYANFFGINNMIAAGRWRKLSII